MVRDGKTSDEPIESTRDAGTSPEQLRARRRSLVGGNTTIANADLTREIIARADADFERIFGLD